MCEIQSSDLLGQLRGWPISEFSQIFLRKYQKRGRGESGWQFTVIYDFAMLWSMVTLSDVYPSPTPLLTLAGSEMGRDSGGRKCTRFLIRREHNSFMGTLGNSLSFRSFLCRVTIIAKYASCFPLLKNSRERDSEGCYEDTKIRVLLHMGIACNNQYLMCFYILTMTMQCVY